MTGNDGQGVAAFARPPAGPGPDAVAMRVKQVRKQVDRLCWTGITSLGLAFRIVLHSVPLLVFTTAEAVTDRHDKLAEAASAVFAGVRQVGEPESARPSKPRPGKTGGRRLFGDYLAEARNAWTPGVEVTPAWVREVTPCSRGLSSWSTLAAEIAERGGKP
jgi:hypothetical protein